MMVAVSVARLMPGWDGGKLPRRHPHRRTRMHFGRSFGMPMRMRPAPWMRQVPSAAQLTALGRRHLLPSLVVVEQMLALIGRKLLEAAESLKNFLALFGRQRSEAAVRLLQLQLAFGRQMPILAHRLQHLMAFVGGQAAELLEIALCGFAFDGIHLLPSAEILQHPLALIRIEVVPHLAVSLDVSLLGRIGRLTRNHLGKDRLNQGNGQYG